MPETPPLPPVTDEPHNVPGPNAEPDMTADEVNDVWMVGEVTSLHQADASKTPVLSPDEH